MRTTANSGERRLGTTGFLMGLGAADLGFSVSGSFFGLSAGYGF